MTTEKNTLRKMYGIINNYISELYSLNNITISDIFKNAKKKDFLNLQDFTFEGIKSIKFLKDDLEKNTIYLYQLLTGKLPISQVILYCNKETTAEEVISFLYRSILFSDFPCLFSIIKPEHLKLEIKLIMIDTIKHLLDKLKINQNSMISCLYFIYYDTYSDIISEIKLLPNYSEYKLNLDSNNKINEIMVYSSSQSGLGKSTRIYNEFEREIHLFYKYFPLGGDISRKDIILRLLQLSPEKSYGFHLDLYDSKQTELIREFLFSFLITKSYCQNEDIFYYGNEFKIKIEIPAFIFEDFFQKYPILNLFNKIPKIQSIPRPKLLVNNQATSNFQITFNILNFYDKGIILNKNINLGLYNMNNVNEEFLTILPLETCEELLKKYLTIKSPNFYQISSFLSILGNQFKLFCSNYFLEVQKDIPPSLKEMRSFFIKCLINVTKHFISSAFSDILEEQKIANKRQNENYDENLAIEEAKKKLIHKNLVSYDKIDPSLIVFNSDGQSLTFICTGKEAVNEKKMISLFLSSQTNNRIKEPPNYRQFKSEDFYDELIQLLDLHRENIRKVNKNLNRIQLRNLYPKKYIEYHDKKWQSIDEIVDSYIFTSDNFIKLILIITRIRADLPVILMGETGCGKTSLIRILYDLQFKYVGNNNNMLIYNIHAGVTDNDIIEFLNQNNLIEKEEKYENPNEEEKWVFFDEINTCNSMGLLSEILCKHSCLGEKLKKNIKFIAACNPYRIISHKFETIGLYDEKKHNQRNLVYAVNPLPPSLLNFIFDFGNLRKEDEKKYINNILSDEFTKFIGNESISFYKRIF